LKARLKSKGRLQLYKIMCKFAKLEKMIREVYRAESTMRTSAG